MERNSRAYSNLTCRISSFFVVDLLPFTHRTQAAASSGDPVAAQEARETVDGITVEKSGATGGHAEGTSLETILEEVRESTCMFVLWFGLYRGLRGLSVADKPSTFLGARRKRS